MNENNKLKILIVNYEHPPIGGGGGVCTKNIAKALVEKGHTVHILTTGIKSLPAHEVEDGVEVFRVPVIGRKGASSPANGRSNAKKLKREPVSW